MQRHTVGSLAEIECPTDGIETCITGQWAGMEIETADSRGLKNFGGDDIQGMDVKQEVHLLRADLAGERGIFDALCGPRAIAESLRCLPERDWTPEPRVW